jgi:cytochrome c5
MKSLKRNVFLLLALSGSLAITSCSKSSSAPYVPAATDVTATATLAQLQQGRTLFVNNCERCHSLYMPENYTAAQWRSILPGMTGRTSLTTADILLLTKYVTKGQ